jgi:hypothetical protein
MTRFLPDIVHLQPPTSTLHTAELHRFSPLFEGRAEFGVTGMRIRPDFEAVLAGVGVAVVLVSIRCGE